MMRLLVITATVLATAGCGGGGGSDFPLNLPPEITVFPATQDITANTSTGNLDIAATDDGDPAQLEATAISSNESVVPNSGLLITGSNGNFSLQITPVADTVGAAAISVTVTDGGGRASARSFNINVVPQPTEFADYLRTTFSDAQNAAPRDVNARVFTDDGSQFDDLLNTP